MTFTVKNGVTYVNYESFNDYSWLKRVWECSSPAVKRDEGIETCRVAAAEVAQEAGARKLVLVHVVPPILNFIVKRMYMKGVSDVYDGDVKLGEDGMTFELLPKI